MIPSLVHPETHPLVRTQLTADRNIAAQAWKQWSSSRDFDHISFAELVLLPGIWQQWKNDDAFVFDDRMNGIVRKFFYQNSVYQQAITEIGESLATQNIPFRRIHDALIQPFMAGAGFTSRVIHRIDFWILSAVVRDTLGILGSLGWTYQRHSRWKAIFHHRNGLQLHLHRALSRHWDLERHDRYFQELKENHAVNAIVDILLSKYATGGLIDLQSTLDFCVLLKSLRQEEYKELTARCRYYLLSYRLERVLQVTKQYTGYLQVESAAQSDPFDDLDIHLQMWQKNKTLSGKIAYHAFRYRLLHTTNQQRIMGYYRYWRMQRSQNKEIDVWVNRFQELLNQK